MTKYFILEWKLTLLVFLLGFIGTAQIIDIPDENLRNAMLFGLVADLNGDYGSDSNVDTNFDGQIQLTEAQAVYGLYLIDMDIASLEGLEYFTNLIWIYASENQISNADVLGNHNMEEIDIGENPIDHFDATPHTNLKGFAFHETQITEIDVSQNPGLEILMLWNADLSVLDISFNPLLRILFCQDNNLTSLDLSNNSMLRNLNVQNNDLTDLSIKNGANSIVIQMLTQGNLNLTCIEVDDTIYANSQDCNIPANSGWCKDNWVEYNEKCLLGTNDNTFKSAYIMYPNPVIDALYIQPINEPIKMSVEVFSFTGTKLSYLKYQNYINTSKLSTGVYFLKVIDEHGFEEILRFIKK